MLPRTIDSEQQLEDLLSEPTDAVVATLARWPGDIVVLGAAGKMGPSLARMAKRASDAAGSRRRVVAVSRFESGNVQWFQDHGIETIACDLLDEQQVRRLPDAANVFYLAGRKFGSTGNESLTWAMNTYLPALVCRRYANSRIVAFSTGNVYPMTAVSSRGSSETDLPQPVGEYAMSCLGRERMFEYFSRQQGTRAAIVRLNYACDLRYGVLVDLACKVWAGEPIDLNMGYFNTIWQGDANAMAIRALDHAASPPWVINVTGLDMLSVRDVCERFARMFERPQHFTGKESTTALLSDARRSFELFGPARVDSAQLIEWVAGWVSRGGRTLNKPTHFEARDGKF